MLDTRIQLPPFSMFPSTPIYEVEVEGESVIVFGLMMEPVSADATDQLFTVPRGGVYRLDLISQSFYGVPDLWHVIASVNNLVDPLVSFAQGQQIRVPTKTRLAQEGILSV